MLNVRRLTPALFSIEGNRDADTFPGYHDDRARWNGWALPYFTRQTVEQVCAMVAADGSDVVLTLDGDTLVHISNPGTEYAFTDRIEPVTVDGVALYPCGLGWVWDTVETDDDDDDA